MVLAIASFILGGIVGMIGMAVIVISKGDDNE